MSTEAIISSFQASFPGLYPEPEPEVPEAGQEEGQNGQDGAADSPAAAPAPEAEDPYGSKVQAIMQRVRACQHSLHLISIGFCADGPTSHWLPIVPGEGRTVAPGVGSRK